MVWFTPKEVEKLTVSENPLGWGAFGIVMRGRIKFKGGKEKSCVVKIHEYPPLDAKRVRRYKSVVQKLRLAGLRIPKTGFLKHGGRLVQVQEKFAGKKLEKHFPSWSSSVKEVQDLRKSPLAKEIINTVSRLCNAGLRPWDDSYDLINTRRGPQAIVYDFDLFLERDPDVEDPFHYHLDMLASGRDEGQVKYFVRAFKRKITNRKALNKLEAWLQRRRAGLPPVWS